MYIKGTDFCSVSIFYWIKDHESCQLWCCRSSHYTKLEVVFVYLIWTFLHLVIINIYFENIHFFHAKLWSDDCANLHWVPVRQRISYKVCFLVRNCLAGAAPEYLSEICQSTSSTSGRQHLRSALRNDLLVPRVRTPNYGARGFAVSGPRLWNSLPTSVRELYDKPEQFKKALKTFLMQQ